MNNEQDTRLWERPDNKSILLSAADIKEILGCNPNTLYNLLNKKDFPSFRINSKYYVVYDDFIKWSRAQVKQYHR